MSRIVIGNDGMTGYIGLGVVMFQQVRRATMNDKPIRMLRAPEVRARTGFTDMHIWRLEKAGKFPRRCKLSEGGRANGWIEEEIEEYLRARTSKRTVLGTEGKPSAQLQD